MSGAGSPAPAPGPAAQRRRDRWLPLLLVPVALLPDLGAALPLRTYFFRDFTVTFLPLRLFAAQELREGRLSSWNPYVFEGSFQLPSLYPPDLLHALWPVPAFVSWLLTLHLPLAALAAYWLARELGTTRIGAFVCGALFALGGFALSSLNLYVFLQALALAPLVAGLLRRAALGGRRAIALAALSIALALSTLAVEFVAQAVLLGLALGIAAAPRVAAAARAAGAVALGIGLAGLPVALVAGLLPETARGSGLAPDVALANALHPAVLLQALLPNVFGLLAAPAEAWWGGRFFSKGTPYFLSLYVGPLAIALGAVGLPRMPHRLRLVAALLAGLALWLALGERGGLAPLLARLPLASALRFPSKALLTPHLLLALAAGFAAGDLASGRERWGAFATALIVTGAAVAAPLTVVAWAGSSVVAWSGVLPAYWPVVADVVRSDALAAGVWIAAALVVAWAVRAARLPPPHAAALVSLLLVADLARAGTGLNRQLAADYFDLAPALRALDLAHLDGGRVFSYGVDSSPAFRAFLAAPRARRSEAAFYAYHQVLGPYTNVLERVESPEATDLTAFSPRPRELRAEDYDAAAVPLLVPWLRNAAVVRILSLDPLADPRLLPLATVPAGGPGLVVHAYALQGPWPPAYLACEVLAAGDAAAGLRTPLAPGFNGSRTVVLVGATPASCAAGRVRRATSEPEHERYDVEAVGGAGYLVVRASFARGWRARVDGTAASVLRANGKHRAVPVPAGRHVVEFDYVPVGWAAGVAASLASLALCAALLVVKS